MIETLRDFAAFLRHPQPVLPRGLDAAGRRIAARMLVLYVAVMLLVLAPLLHQWQQALHLPAPEAFDQVGRAWLLPLVVVLAPVGEEIAFRGWLTGRPRALFLLLCGLAFAAALALVMANPGRPAPAWLAVAVVPAALAGWWRLRRQRMVPGWFARWFPALFHGAALAFALSHLVNYPVFALAMLPLVLPQLWAGLVLGYVRLRVGLPASMLVHGTANAVAIGLALATG